MNYETKSNNKDDFDRDTGYWNQYYAKNVAPNEPSNFAIWVWEQYIHEKSECSLLELGCGNGRDSLFFYNKGCKVTAIDASDAAVAFLQEQTKTETDITFVCDDFVKNTADYDSQWDYIYSRFSIHAIDKYQQDRLIKNVYCALKTDALFMIEVRGIHDEIYGLGKCVGEDTYIYEGHMRRFIRMEELKQELKHCGFEIDYAVEDTGFAPYAESNPRVIRIIARKI